MGIPYLRRRLQPYSESRCLGRNSIDCERHKLNTRAQNPNVIVDGPCLAYFVYYRLIAHKSISLGPIDAQPSYEELGRGVIALLNQLESSGLRIDRIYFDGYLPDEKRPVREARLDQALRSLVAYRSQHPRGFETNIALENDSSLRIEQIGLKVLTPRSTPKRFLGVPPGSFINAAVLECLVHSAYARVTQVVPGEADPYCAHRARSEGGIILTSDSDLLVHDLGCDGSVVFIEQLEFRYTNCGSSKTMNCISIRANIFEPHDVAHELGIPDMIGLAFVMSQHQSMEVQQILSTMALPKAGDPHCTKVEEFPPFVTHYQMMPLQVEKSNFDPISIRHFEASGSILDTRLSELVLQLATKGRYISTMFLWPIEQDPSRKSAWAASAEIRTLAYACLQYWYTPGAPEARAIYEYTRKGQRFLNQLVPVLDLLNGEKGIGGHAEHICGLYLAITDRFAFNSIAMIWRLVGMKLVLTWYEDEGKSIPTAQTIENVMTGNAGSVWSWEDLHLTAQIHAALYSLRMVKQSLCFISKMEEKVNFFGPIRSLFDVLGGLPELKLLIPTRLELKAHSTLLLEADWSQDAATLIRMGEDGM